VRATIKTQKFIKYLKDNDCEWAEDGKKHAVYINTKTGATSRVPRHPVIKEGTAREICKELGIPFPTSLGEPVIVRIGEKYYELQTASNRSKQPQIAPKVQFF
jgi:hypothetical protein